MATADRGPVCRRGAAVVVASVASLRPIIAGRTRARADSRFPWDRVVRRWYPLERVRPRSIPDRGHRPALSTQNNPAGGDGALSGIASAHLFAGYTVDPRAARQGLKKQPPIMNRYPDMLESYIELIYWHQARRSFVCAPLICGACLVKCSFPGKFSTSYRWPQNQIPCLHNIHGISCKVCCSITLIPELF